MSFILDVLSESGGVHLLGPASKENVKRTPSQAPHNHCRERVRVVCSHVVARAMLWGALTRYQAAGCEGPHVDRADTREGQAASIEDVSAAGGSFVSAFLSSA